MSIQFHLFNVFIFRMYNTSLKGPGRVIMSSMPLGKIRQLFTQPAATKQKKAKNGVN
jgi:hypothetical protein